MPSRRRWSESPSRTSTTGTGHDRPRSSGHAHGGSRRAERTPPPPAEQPEAPSEVEAAALDADESYPADPPQPPPPAPDPLAGTVTQAQPAGLLQAPPAVPPAVPAPVASRADLGAPGEAPMATAPAAVHEQAPQFGREPRRYPQPFAHQRGPRQDMALHGGHPGAPVQGQPQGSPAQGALMHGAPQPTGGAPGVGQPQPQGQQAEVRPIEYRDILKQEARIIQRLCKEYGLRPDTKLRKEHIAYQVYKAMAEAQNRNVHLSLGTLEILPDGYGFLRTRTYVIDETDVYVSPSQIKRFGLRTGDQVIGQVRMPKENESYHALLRVEAVNFIEPELAKNRPHFDELIPLYPSERYVLETEPDKISARLVDLISPVGRGQRGLIVAPPKAGKTTLIKDIANAITHNHPDAYVMILLIDERPEEVTDMQRGVSAEVASSTFDEPIANHLRVSEMILEKAKRLVEQGEHVVILMDSLTRLARAYNISVPSSGQTLSGGVNPHALQKPKRFFGSARAVEFGGSLTCIATALIDTGNKMDDFIFEEFKGTGNMELHLDRELFNKRIFPSVDVKMSGTRKEELLIGDDAVKKMHVLRRVLASVSPQEALELLLKHLKKAKTNADFLGALNQAELMEA